MKMHLQNLKKLRNRLLCFRNKITLSYVTDDNTSILESYIKRKH